MSIRRAPIISAIYNKSKTKLFPPSTDAFTLVGVFAIQFSFLILWRL